MSAAQVVTIILTSVTGVALRQLVGFWRYRLRRESIERAVTVAGPGTRIIDRDADGADIDVRVQNVSDDSVRQRMQAPELPAS